MTYDPKATGPIWSMQHPSNISGVSTGGVSTGGNSTRGLTSPRLTPPASLSRRKKQKTSLRSESGFIGLDNGKTKQFGDTSDAVFLDTIISSRESMGAHVDPEISITEDISSSLGENVKNMDSMDNMNDRSDMSGVGGMNDMNDINDMGNPSTHLLDLSSSSSTHLLAQFHQDEDQDEDQDHDPDAKPGILSRRSSFISQGYTDPSTIAGEKSTAFLSINSLDYSRDNTETLSLSSYSFNEVPRGRSLGALDTSSGSGTKRPCRSISPPLNVNTSKDADALCILSERYLRTSNDNTDTCKMLDADNQPVTVNLQTTLMGNWNLTPVNPTKISKMQMQTETYPPAKQLTFYRRNLFSNQVKAFFSSNPIRISTSDEGHSSNGSSDYELITKVVVHLELLTDSQRGKKDADLVDKTGKLVQEVEVPLRSSTDETHETHQSGSSDQRQVDYNYRKIKFSASTTNNGAPNKQPCFQVKTILAAYTHTGKRVTIAETFSKSVVVRGRHPSFYKDRFGLNISGDMIVNPMAAVAGTAEKPSAISKRKLEKQKETKFKANFRAKPESNVKAKAKAKVAQESGASSADPSGAPSGASSASPNAPSSPSMVETVDQSSLFYMSNASFYTQQSQPQSLSHHDFFIAPTHEHQDHDICASDSSEFQDDLSWSETSSHTALDLTIERPISLDIGGSDQLFQNKTIDSISPERSLRTDGSSDISYEYFPLDSNNQEQPIYGYYYPHYEHICGEGEPKRHKPGQMFYRALEHIDE